MNIDLTKLMIGNEEEIIIEENLEFPKEKLINTNILELKNIKVNGSITKLYDDIYEITGSITGIMVLPDDVTLEPVDCDFESKFEEKFKESGENEEKSLEIIKNRLDITEFLWQNILVEIPLKVVSEKNQNLNLKGNGWRLITEEELKNRKSDDSPFSELYNLIDSRKE